MTTTTRPALIAYQAHGNTFLLQYDPRDPKSAFRAIGKWLTNPHVAFTHYDAAMLARRVGLRAKCDGVVW